MKENKTWTNEDIKLLISMKDARYALKDMATHFSVTVNCVSKALSRYHKDYIKIDRQCVIKNQEEDVNKIRSLSYGVEWFNKHMGAKNHHYIITKITENNYSYGIMHNLSYLSLIIIINEQRIKANLLTIKLWNLILL